MPKQRQVSIRSIVGVVGGLLGVAAVAVLLVVTLSSDDEDTAAPATTDARTTTAAPAATTATTTAPRTAAAPAATTTAAASTPAPPSVPDQIDGLLGPVEVSGYSDLAGSSTLVTFDGNSQRDSDGTSLTGGDGAVVYPRDRLVAGQGMVFRFRYAAGTSLVFVIENQVEFEQPGYQRFGFRMGPEWNPDFVLTEHYDPGEITGFAAVGDFQLEPGQDYIAALALRDGAEFLLGVWEAGSAAEGAVDVRQFGSDWTGPYGSYVAVESGELTLIEYWEIEIPG